MLHVISSILAGPDMIGMVAPRPLLNNFTSIPTPAAPAVVTCAETQTMTFLRDSGAPEFRRLSTAGLP